MAGAGPAAARPHNPRRWRGTRANHPEMMPAPGSGLRAFPRQATSDRQHAFVLSPAPSRNLPPLPASGFLRRFRRRSDRGHHRAGALDGVGHRQRTHAGRGRGHGDHRGIPHRRVQRLPGSNRRADRGVHPGRRRRRARLRRGRARRLHAAGGRDAHRHGCRPAWLPSSFRAHSCSGPPTGWRAS